MKIVLSRWNDRIRRRSWLSLPLLVVEPAEKYGRHRGTQRSLLELLEQRKDNVDNLTDTRHW